MIVGKLEHVGRYYGISERLDTAIAFMEREPVGEYAEGHYPIDGEDVYMNRFDYRTEPEDGMFESHKHFLDIHLVLEGEEGLGYADEDGLTVIQGYDEARDISFLDGEEEARVLLTAGTFAICFPEDAHMPKVCIGEPSDVRKAVLKVRVAQ